MYSWTREEDKDEVGDEDGERDIYIDEKFLSSIEWGAREIK